ncbi:LLM class flavin-dependent oxidoreductase [Rhizobium leguminosarum]|uniref:LLM class flavin-dependent oxidoreductase n=1 Tax=Rhizobium leguminosarum TaxID=384 RepID=UPI001C8FF548|nr:LLM class flavin-dependent oxidoreductase [Rhizobium leguminosarum]MBY2915118.1 LLM class flavin-dependent oxidoreductase [Rhizobium leguminosarum]MBY2970657.1 LLM class flavin-dependent oxidoreductase [Rhizobium leguminosarum]MBY2977724.1 LLM class flavin-dependent oxidoreductase [Rhizobium leguminosarum]MBY3006274.1 LLM class flavin-dependent oxidoreductase [Rhizobium leguminosarum]
MHLGFSLTPFGHHPAAWRNAGTPGHLGFDSLLSQIAKAEEAGFDFVLLPDRLGARPVDDLSPIATPFEPTTLVAALATKARRIGFLAAAATSQHEPYNLARRFASLDQISGGRTGWVALPASGDFERDQEYLRLVGALWDSWEDDAFIYDKQQGRFFEPSKMHVLNHRGKHFTVRGPLNVNRSPQGKPVIAQFLSGGSKTLAAHSAEIVLLQDRTLESANDTAADFVRVLEATGRQRRDVRILANIVPIIAETSEAAHAASDALRFGEAERASQPLSASRLVGTPAEIADTLQRWFETGNLDGFTILPPTLGTADLFLAEVAPELQRRSLTGKIKAGSTLREYLGLPRPAHPNAVERAS